MSAVDDGAEPASGNPQSGATPTRPRPVPWLVPYEGDEPLGMPVIVRPLGRGIQYSDEITLDRDPMGVLLARGRRPAPQGREGRPLFGEVDVRRQRRAQRGMLCQICGASAVFQHEGGALWLIDDTPEPNPSGWPEGLTVVHPPVCPKCAPRAAAYCPELRKGCTTVVVREPRPWGYFGTLYGPHVTRPGLVPQVREADAYIPYEDERLPWLLARQLVVQLNSCAPVDLDTLLAHHSENA